MSLDQKFSPFDFRFMDFSPIPTLRKHNEFSDSLQISSSEILSNVNTPTLPRLLVLSSYFSCCINMNRQLHTAAVLLSVRPFRPISRSRPLELRPCAGVCAAVRPPATATLGSVTRLWRLKRSLLVLSVRACAHHHHALAEVGLFCTIDN